MEKEDKIDNAVGIVLNKKIGDSIENGEVLAYVHAQVEEKAYQAIEELKKAYLISKDKPQKKIHIIDVIS